MCSNLGGAWPVEATPDVEQGRRDALITSIDLRNMLLFGSGITVPADAVGCTVSKRELIRFLPNFPVSLGFEKVVL